MRSIILLRQQADPSLLVAYYATAYMQDWTMLYICNTETWQVTCAMLLKAVL